MPRVPNRFYAKRPKALSSEEIELWHTLESLAGAESLLDWVPIMSPTFARPEHLVKLAEVLVRAQFEPVYAWISVPPRHSKTETIAHSVPWRLLRDPTTQVAYCTYEANLAYSKSRRMREIASQVGVKLKRGSTGVQEWQTQEGGQVIATGVGGPLTGKGCNLLIIDDPLKNREEAESPVIRQKIWDWFTSTALTRVEPGGSVIVCHCIAKGEPVLLASGAWKSIEDVKPGDTVAAYENKQFVSREVLAQKLSGVDPILQIATRTKSAKTNARHPFLLATGEWRKAGDLKVGDIITTVNKGYGATDIDPELAWFFGFLMGDGWVTQWKRKNFDKKRNKYYESNSWCVCFAAGIYPELNERAIKACEKFFGKPKLTKHGYYRLDSNSAGRELQKLGLTGGAHGKRVPHWVFELKPEHKISYLRGYADADGTEPSRTIDSCLVASVSKDLIQDTQKLCISAGVRHGKLTSSTQLVKAPNSKEAKLSTIYKTYINFNKEPDLFEEIIEITNLQESPVYDLTVEGAENFIVGGFVCHNTRWHDDDMIGRIQNEFPNWTGIQMPAVEETVERVTINGKTVEQQHRRALWPSRWPLEELDKKRRLVGEYDWAALFQGQPRPKGGRMFGSASRYDYPNIADENVPYKIVIGADPAATEKTNADFSSICVMSFTGHSELDPQTNKYIPTLDFKGDILEVWRGQVQITEFVKRLRDTSIKWGAPIVVEAVAGFKAIPQMLRAIDKSLKVIEAPVMGDKFTRALPASAAWNDPEGGRIRVPSDIRNNPWVPDFLSEVEKFTGVKDAHDDQVDAMAHCFNAAVTMMPTMVVRKQVGRPSNLPFG